MMEVLDLDENAPEHPDGSDPPPPGGRIPIIEAAFKEMGLSYVLPDVICGFCNHAHDLDLCRDPSVNLPEKRDRFSCANCASPYDKDNLELRLVEAVQRRSTK